jgi:1-acyl-sn-glycerol-3-phosphate acyltransferase
MISLWLRSLAFNVGWYLGTTILAIVGSPILLMPRRYVVAWSLFWIDFCLACCA